VKIQKCVLKKFNSTYIYFIQGRVNNLKNVRICSNISNKFNEECSIKDITFDLFINPILLMSFSEFNDPRVK